MGGAVSDLRTRYSHLVEGVIDPKCERGVVSNEHDQILYDMQINTLKQKIEDLKNNNAQLSQELSQAKGQFQSLQHEHEVYKRNSIPAPMDIKDRLPEEAPILYKDWKQLPENKGKTPLDCLREVWGKYLEGGLLYQDDLRGKNGLDPYLMKRASQYVYVNHIPDHPYMPPPKSERLNAIRDKIDIKKAFQISKIASK